MRASWRCWTLAWWQRSQHKTEQQWWGGCCGELSCTSCATKCIVCRAGTGVCCAGAEAFGVLCDHHSLTEPGPFLTCCTTAHT